MYIELDLMACASCGDLENCLRLTILNLPLIHLWSFNMSNMNTLLLKLSHVRPFNHMASGYDKVRMTCTDLDNRSSSIDLIAICSTYQGPNK